MALNIKNAQVERLVDEIVEVTGETKTDAVRRALEERRERLELQGRRPRTLEEIREFMEREVWSKLPPGVRGRGPTTEEQEEILGLGPEGY